MKSKWMVSSNFINGRTMYIAARLIDKDAVDHSGNREFYGDYSDNRENIEKIVEELNKIK